MDRNDFRFCIDESRIEQQIVRPYKILALFLFIYFLCLSFAPVVFLCTCSRNFIYECIRGKDFSYKENRNLSTAGGNISQYSSLYFSKRKGSLLSDNISIIRLDSC